MNDAQKKFANTRDLHENEYETFNNWDRAESCAVSLHALCPECHLIDIMVPNWKDWLLFFPNTNKNTKSAALNKLFNRQLNTIVKALSFNFKYTTLDKIEQNLHNLIDAAIYAEAIKYRLTEENLCDLNGKQLQAISRDTFNKYKVNHLELVSGRLLLHITTYLDFLFRHNAHDESSMEITIHPTALFDLAQRLLTIEKETSELSAIINQQKSRIKAKNIQEIAKEMWIQNGKKRTLDEAVFLQQELQKHDIKRSSKTIYDWICMW